MKKTILPDKEKDLVLYDGAILYYLLDRERMAALSSEEAREIALATDERVKEIAKEYGVSEEKAYSMYINMGKIAEGYGDWVLQQGKKDKNP